MSYCDVQRSIMAAHRDAVEKSGGNGLAILNVFVSTRMNCVPEIQVRQRQHECFDLFAEIYYKLAPSNPKVSLKLIETYSKPDAPVTARDIWFLGDSIKLMDSADIIIFANGWDKSSGCNVEHDIAVKYRRNYVFESELCYIKDNYER